MRVFVAHSVAGGEPDVLTVLVTLGLFGVKRVGIRDSQVGDGNDLGTHRARRLPRT